MSRVVALALLFSAAVAAAHGRAAYTVSVAPHPSDGRALVGTTYGVLRSDSTGAFDFICPQAIGYEDLIDPKLVWAKDGTMFAAVSGTKLARSTDDGCHWTDIPALAATGAADFIEDPTAPGTYWATSTKFGQTNALFKSTDGVNFAPTSVSRPNSYFAGVAVAPSNGQRIYVTGWYNDPLAAWLFRSDDRGQTFTESTPSLPGQSGFRVLAVHPTNPDLVFAFVFGNGAQSLLLRSADAGATWTTVVTTDDLMRSFWISSDGRTAYFATARKMHRSTDDGVTFAEVPPWAINACIFGRDSELWTCGREPANPFVVGRFSLANPSIVTALGRNQDIRGPLSCPAGTTVGDSCPAQWPLIAATLGVPLTPPDAGQSGADGGSIDEPIEPSPCGCGAFGPLLLLLGVSVFSLRRRI